MPGRRRTRNTDAQLRALPRRPRISAAQKLSVWRVRVPRACGLRRGFTLVELTVALVLMAGMAAVLFGSLSLAARSWDAGEAKVAQVDDMRQTHLYLREQISSLYPQRLRKAAEVPLLFAGERDELRYAAALPSRVAEGGVYYFRLALNRAGDKSQLVQERVIPDLLALGRARIRRGRALGACARASRSSRSAISVAIPMPAMSCAVVARSLGRSAASADRDADRREAAQRRAVADAGRGAAARPGGGVCDAADPGIRSPLARPASTRSATAP